MNSNVQNAPWWIDAAAGVIRRLPAGRYRAMNLVSGRSAPFWARMPPELGSLQFQCHLRDRIMREVCFTGRYEPQETAILQQLLGPGKVFVDVGANWGYFTLAGAHLVGRSGRVVSVEVDPRACAMLRQNVARNALDQVRVCELAASDQPGTLQMREYETAASDSGNFGLARTTTVVENGREFQVAARRLDDVFDEIGIGGVDLLKMDIEGAEGLAIAGLGRALGSRRVKHLLLELHPAHLVGLGSSASRVIDDLRAHGYRPWKIDHSPAAYRRFAEGESDVTAALSPFQDGDDLGAWPHLLWA
jgi:FkbM family methyltransferase